MAKGEIAHHYEVHLCYNVSQSRLLQRRQKASICGQRVKQSTTRYHGGHWFDTQRSSLRNNVQSPTVIKIKILLKTQN